VLICDHALNPQLVDYIKSIVTTKYITVYMNSFKPQQDNEFRVVRIGKHHKYQMISPELVEAFDRALVNRPAH
jgi:hypothetical protein